LKTIQFYIKAFNFSILTILLLFIHISCSTNTETNTNSSFQSKKVEIAKSIVAKNPITPSPDTCSPPQQIDISTVGESITLNSGEIIKSALAEIKTADFLSKMKNYTTDDGLALDPIASSIMDSKGNLWFGTYGGGVSKYNGYNFTNFTTAHGLANNFVSSIAEDKKGNLWFGTSGGGVSCYNGITFKNYTTKQGLTNDIIRCITEDNKGNIWFGTNGGGVSKFNGKKFTNYSIKNGLANNNVRSILQDVNGNIWFGTDGSGVSKFNGKKFKTFTVKNGLAFDVVRSIIQDKEGYIWFGTNGGGVSRYNGKSFKNFTSKDGLSNDIITCITEDNKGNIWLGTQDGGASFYDGNKFINFTENQGLVNNNVRSITEDLAGNIWLGTQGGGVSRYDGNSFINYTKEQGLSNNIILTITEDDFGNIWYGTYGGGVIKYDGKTFTNYTIKQGLANDVVYSITKDSKGNLWFGTQGGGVSKFNGKTFTNYTTKQGLTNNVVICSAEDKKGNIWFGTLGGGVSKFDGKKFSNYTMKQGLLFNIILSMKIDSKGIIWFGTNGEGVSKFDGKNFTNFTIKNGLGDNLVLSITEDKFGNIWFGTDGRGVSRYDGKSFLNFTKTQGIPDNTITQVVLDDLGNLVLGTNFGVAVVSKLKTRNQSNSAQKILPIQNELSNIELKKYVPVFEIFNSSTGYPVKDVNAGQNAMFKDKKGIIWIATGADKTALVRFNSKNLKKNKKKPTVQIHSVKINNENICWYDISDKHIKQSLKERKDSTITQPNIIEEVLLEDRVLEEEERDIMRQKFKHIQFESISKFDPIPQKLVLPHKQGNITFEFSAIESSKPYLINYQYMLEGYDDSWSPANNRNTATFGNIYEGSYTFKLKAQNPNGIWSDTIKYKFTVLPPWWRTWWMFTIYILVIIGIVFLIVWVNGQRLRASALELTLQIRKATSTIVEQKQVVEEQKVIVEKKNRDITDSINYALRIQHAFLPKKENILKSFPESFILFKPKDIVSGDFYFHQKKNNKIFIAAADCTGHGVPGAFMSMISSERLTDALQECDQPNEILTVLNRGVKKSLNQTDKEDSTRDGLDIALCSVDIKNRSVLYSGANRPIWIMRKKGAEIEEIKATKIAIGGLTKDDQQFDLHTIQFEEGDSFYLSTDGYGDLFSDDGKKLKTKKLKELLAEIRDKSMPEQEAFLDDFAEIWKNGSEQIDDILIIGIRF